MVVHIVLWNLLDTAEGFTKLENGMRIKREMEGLVGVVSGMTHCSVGLGFNPVGYDFGMVSHFESREAYEVYRAHPAHLEVKEFVRKVISDRAIFDCERD